MKTLLFIYLVASLQIFSMSFYMIEGPSMAPTFKTDDIFVIDSGFKGDFNRGDIVVFAFNEDPDYNYVKRIIGLPGEKVHIKADGIYLGDDEVKLDEPYIKEGTRTAIETESYRDGYKHTYSVPAGKYFVLGDNRDSSLDSRYFKDPFVEESEISGKYILKLPNL